MSALAAAKRAREPRVDALPVEVLALDLVSSDNRWTLFAPRRPVVLRMTVPRRSNEGALRYEKSPRAAQDQACRSEVSSPAARSTRTR